VLEGNVGVLHAASGDLALEARSERGAGGEPRQHDLLEASSRAGQEREPQLERWRIGAEDALEVDHDVRDLAGLPEELANDALHGGEGQLTLELVDARCRGRPRPVPGSQPRDAAASS
jgi:hypothetical protein